MKESTILQKAAELIEKKGWCTGTLHKPDDGYCIMGAILKISGIDDGEKTESKLYKQFPDMPHLVRVTQVAESRKLWEFNDVYVGMTKRKIIAALRKAAKNAKKAGQ